MDTFNFYNDKVKVYSTDIIKLNDLDWIASGAGKYWAYMDIHIPNLRQIVSIYLNGWGYIRVTDMFDFYVNNNNSIYMLSNTNTFDSVNTSVNLNIGYI